MTSKLARDQIARDTMALDGEFDGFDLLTEEEQSQYIDLLEQLVGPSWGLSSKQQFAELLWNKVDWMLWGGAAGGGKSEFATWHANRLSMEIDGHATLLLRQSIPELRRSLIIRLIARARQFDIPMRYRKVDGQTAFHYTNGSIIECGFLKTDENLGNYLSAEYGCIIVDEASQLTPDQIKQMAARLRVTKEASTRGARTHLGLFTNPGDVGHAWLYGLFVTPTQYGDRVVIYNIANGLEDGERFIVREYVLPTWERADGTVGSMASATPDEIDLYLMPWVEDVVIECDPETELAVAFVPSRATDNPFIDRSYLKMLNTLPELRRRQLRDGDWDTFSGQFFHEWRKDLHVVDPFDIPESWIKARGADWGGSAPWCLLQGAWDPDGNLYVYREAYGGGLSPKEQAEQAVANELFDVFAEDGSMRQVRHRYAATVADPAVFAGQRGTGESIAQQWSKHGLRVTKANNSRRAGWANLRQYLWDRGKVAHDATLGAPRVFFFSTCTNLVRTITLQQTSKDDPEDCDTHLEDHAVDALRYLAAWRPIGVRERLQNLGQSIDQRFQKLMSRPGKTRRKTWS